MYQKRLLLLLFIQMVIFAFNIISGMFILPSPVFDCNGNDCNESYGGCESQILKHTRDTLTNHYKLYCDKKYKFNVFLFI